MKNYIILLIVLILISCQCNKGRGFPTDRYVDSIQHIEYKIQKNHMGSILTAGDVQITFTPNGHIMGIKNKSLKDGHIRVYYFLDKRDKDEISHFYTFKNGLDRVAVFYHCENIINYCCPIKPLYTAISSLNPAEIGMISSYFKFQAPLE